MDLNIRSLSVIKSMKWELINQIIVILLSFLAPRYIILVYGSEVNGLTSTINQLMRIILMLQAGATTASLYSLYKPVADNDKELIGKKIAGIVLFFKKISFCFFIITIIVALIFPKFINSTLNNWAVIISFIILGIRNGLDLLFTSRYRIIFTTFQKKHLISIGMLIEQTIYYGLVFLSLYYRIYFILMYCWFVVGCILKIVFFCICYKKEFGNSIPKYKATPQDIIVDRNYSLANEVSHSVVTSSITVLMSFLYGLEVASVYSVYSLVIKAIGVFSDSASASFAPSFGNLVAEHDNEKILSIFDFFQYIFYMFNTLLFMCVLYLILPFIKLYTSGIDDFEYINVLLAVLIVCNGMFSAFRVPYNVVVSTYGLFKETYRQPMISAGISLALSIGLGKLNYSLIMIGPIVFYCTNFFYQHYKIKQLTQILPTNKSVVHISISLGGILLAFGAFYFFPLKEVTTLKWLLCALLSIIFSILYIIVMMILFEKENLSLLKTYARRITASIWEKNNG